jgi:soluble lytic murein transglycosylase-like protein
MRLPSNLWLWIAGGAALLYLLATQTRTGEDVVAQITGGWRTAGQGPQMLPLLNAAEDQYGIPRDLLARQAYQESHFRADIISGATSSPAGAQGLMQLIPRFYPGVDPLDQAQAIDAAAKSMVGYFRQFGSWPLALAAYNWGPGNLAKHGADSASWPQETRNYVAQITADVPEANA